ncbi:GNAT family N-acetyltransferase [Arthrobacter sp. NPDC090010]|uniref:GNAT family N-acetyltransferase n=1 Tax=Arthrobacter sp. NPDC090010 TaxID=3363942 RepID=UPI0037FED8AE
MDLTTDRLSLRRPGWEDVDRVLAICQDPDIMAFATVPDPCLHQDALSFITEAIPAGCWAAGTGLAWGMCRRDSSELIGLISLSHIHDGAAELGYCHLAGSDRIVRN